MKLWESNSLKFRVISNVHQIISFGYRRQRSLLSNIPEKLVIT